MHQPLFPQTQSSVSAYCGLNKLLLFLLRNQAMGNDHPSLQWLLETKVSHPILFILRIYVIFGNIHAQRGNFKAWCAFLRTNFTVNSLRFFLYDYVCIKSEKNLFIKKMVEMLSVEHLLICMKSILFPQLLFVHTECIVRWTPHTQSSLSFL